jgi:hypothetical protein
MLFEWNRIDCGMGLLPEASRDLQGVHPLAFPPGALITVLMQLPMMAAAQRHRQFIAHLEATGSGWQTADDVDRRVPAADDARL